MPFASLPGAKLYYEESGFGAPLVLIAGLGGTLAYWKAQIDEFSKSFRVIAFDQRGTGKSIAESEDCTLDLLAQDLIGLLDALDLQEVSALGHSTGGMLLQVAAIRHPERFSRLVLYGSRGGTDAFTRTAMGMRLALLRSGGIEPFVRSTPIFLYPSWWIRENEVMLDGTIELAIRNAPSPKVTENRILAVLQHDQLRDMHGITQPTLIVCALDDFLTPPYYSQELASLIPNAYLRHVEKGGHACSQTNPQAFNQVVTSFLQTDRTQGKQKCDTKT